MPALIRVAASQGAVWPNIVLQKQLMMFVAGNATNVGRVLAYDERGEARSAAARQWATRLPTLDYGESAGSCAVAFHFFVDF